jgi:hypothetical protein
MKKLLVSILAIVYLTVSSGATLHMHYCMGKLMSWDLSQKQTSKCGTCGMEKAGHKGCCSDEHKTFKIEKDQKISISDFQYSPDYTDAVTPGYTNLPFIHTLSISIDSPTAHEPPRSNTPIFVLNRNFRI